MNTPNTSNRILNDLIFVENIHNEDLFDQGQKAEFIKTLEAEIGKRWHDRVNNIKSMFVLFVGQDTKLLQALGSYYYLTRGKTCLSFYSLGGKTDDELKGMFSQVEAFRTGNNKITDGNLLERLRQGCSVFLDCLRCKDGLFLEWLVSEIRDVERQYHYNKGMLIVSTLTPLTDIPEYFQSLFEVIELEPGKQSENVRDFMPFPTPAGTMWHEVKISFIDGENVKISIRGNTESRHYSQMGFKDSRSGIKPVKSWNILLLFRENKPLPVPHRDKGRVEDCIRDLRKRLRAYFGIQDDPIIFGHEYKPKFEVSIYEEQSRSVRAFSNSDSFDDKEDD